MNSLSPILVTGGAGFIGSNFIHYLLRFWPGVEIINLDRLNYSGSLENLKDLPVASRHTFVRGDVGDSALVEDLPRRHRIEMVVHFAGETHVDRSIAGPEAFIEANVVGTFRLLEACRKTWLPPAPERVTPATAAPAGSRRLGSSWRRPGSTTSTCAGPFCSGRADGAPSRAGRRRGDDRTAQHWSRPIAGRPPRGRRAFSLRRLRFPARGGHVAAGVGSFPASADVRVDQTRRATRARAGHLISACSVEAPSGETVSASASAGSLWNGPSPEAGLRRRGLGHARCGLLAPCGRNHTSTPGSPASRPDSGH